jgi:Ca-activated chloride channel family protein
MKKILLTASILSSLFLVGCGGDNTTSSTSQAKNSNENVSIINDLPTSKKTGDFEWNWLANYPVTSIQEEKLYTKNYYFVLDGSGSMDERPGSCNPNNNNMKIDIAKEAINQFIKTIPVEDNIGLLAFDSGGINERELLGVSNRDSFKSSLMQVKADSGTPLKTAIKNAYHNVRKQAANQAGHGEYNIIVVTDGAASTGENPSKIVKEIASNSPVNLYTIGFCIGNEHVLNNKEYVHYFTANDAASIMSGLSEVLAESEVTFD